MQTDVDTEEFFYGVYLLYCVNTKYIGRTYIGFTVDPNRRIKQHNRGKSFGGAWRTSNRGPWKMVLIIHGFPNDIAALRFEWAWAHPDTSRRLRHVTQKRRNENTFDFCLRVLSEMLNIGPWNRLPLTIRWLEKDFARDFPAEKIPPIHMSICYGPVLSKKLMKIPESDVSLAHGDDDDGIFSCAVCEKYIENGKGLKCLHPDCDMISHITCLSKLFLAEREYVPISGHCPKCKQYLLWGDLGPKPKGGKTKAAPVIIDGVNTSEMTREQLEQFGLRLKEELEREREERNFFQLERDKLRTFWEITRNDLEEANAKLRNKDREIEVVSEKNDDEIKCYQQKVKHLQYENQNHLAELKAEATISLQNAQEDHMEQENELLRDKKDLKKKLRNSEQANQDQIKDLKLQLGEEIHQERQRFYQMAKETEMKFEKQYEIFRIEVHTKHTMEMKEVEERKNQQIQCLIEDHEKAFNEIKNYYNDITLNNLALINSLKEQMEELNRQNERMCKQVADVTVENKKLVEPLRAAEAEAKELRRRLQNYNKDQIVLANTLTKLQNTEQELQDLKWANNALEIRFEKASTEREFLRENFGKGMLEIQQKTGLKNMLLQKKVQALVEILESKDVMLSELVAATNMKPHTINRKLEELLKKRNTIIKDLQYELARVCKAHDDLLLTYETKLLQYGIPQSDLGFTPLRVAQDGQSGLSRGPAGLVTRNR